MKKIVLSLLFLSVSIGVLNAQEEYADIIIDSYYNPVNYPDIDIFYGSIPGNSCVMEEIPLSACLGNNPSFLCINQGSYVTVGFTDNFILDAPGQNDLFIEEKGQSNEFADVYISSDFGQTFTYFGIVNGGTTNGLDLADIGYTDPVNAVKIEGRDNLGCAPGFDVVTIYGLPGANCSANADLAEAPILCLDSGNFDLSTLVLGTPGGTWAGLHVNDNEFETDTEGSFLLKYTVIDEVPICPSDERFIVIEVAACDCAGTPNGIAILDECGVCLEPGDPLFNQSCLDCAGVINGNSILDECGVCLPVDDPQFNQSCADCAGTPNGTAELDRCGICLEPDDPLFDQECIDCFGIIDGTAVLDECGVCLEPDDPTFNQSCADCAGTPNGDAILDECGLCLLPDDPAFNQSCADCAGTPNGDAILDECGICLLPDDPTFNQSCADCTGIPNGTAILDECGICLQADDPTFNQACADCAGTPNGDAILDECGVCLSPDDPAFNQSCADCTGTPNGDAIIDECGVCLSPNDPAFNQSCADCAGTPNGDLILDECGTCLLPNDPAYNQACLDCAGIPNGTAIIDECGDCRRPTDPRFNQACVDCAGTPNGTAVIDNCWVCMEPDDPEFGQSCIDKNFVFIPNAFSPNGDGANDYFKVFAAEGIADRITIYRVFNRWGGLVYEAKDFPIDDETYWWDGLDRNGKLQSTGVYVYFVEVLFSDGGVKNFSGDISVVR